MPVSKTTTTSTKTAKKSDRLELAQAISSLVTKQDAFNKAVKAMEEFSNDKLSDLDLQIESKQTELTKLDDEFNKVQKDREIEINQYLAEYKYKGAVDLIKERDEEPIKSSELSKLKKELDLLKASDKKEIELAVRDEKAKGEQALKSALHNKEMSHKAETAELQATAKHQLKEIENLHETIENLRDEISAQRKLTKEVAESNKSAPITVNSSK